MSTRFDYVKYDEQATSLQGAFKAQMCQVEMAISKNLIDGRAKSLALTKLEEVYMWIGKAIRDEQVEKRGAELQEGRSNE
jgi:hypothetical protein